jgi:signal transduction histidine kinase/CheY-like chemotaxis protein
MSSGHQALTQRALRSTLHTISILMQGKSTEEPVFHFTIPNDEITKAQPLLGLSHGTLAMVALFFDEKLGIAWQILSEILANGLDKSAPGLPIFFIFHLYATIVAHGVLIGSMVSGDGEEGSHSVSEQDRDKLKEVMKSSSKTLENLNRMAPIFTPFAMVAKACIADAIDDKPLDALQLFESAVAYLSKEKPGKHWDIVAISQLISASICRRAKLTSIQAVYFSSAIFTLEKWGAHHVVERLSKEIKSYTGNGRSSQSVNARSSQTGSAHLLTSDGSNCLNSADRSTPGSSDRLTTPSSEHFHPSCTSRSDPKHAPDFASVLTIASYITSFSSFDELTEKLSSTLLKQATATRFLLLMRHPETGVLEPTAQYNLEGLSPPDTLRNAKYSVPIVKVTEQLQEIVVVHSAQQESPYCFQPYIKDSGVCSVASLPIIYQNSLVAIIYMEHEFTQGVFTMEIMSTMALLGQHVASAIVNAKLLRDNRKRTTQLEHSHAILAKALRVKDTILSNTSHELRTPLSGIIGLNENVLNSTIALHPEVQSCMETTLVLARDLLSLVSDILDMQRVNEGALRLKYKPTSLHSLVRNVLDATRFTSANHIHLVNDVSKSFPKIMVDPARIKQVIFNLTANAVKFTSEGSVTIASELLDDGRMIMITVTDTGIGIDPAHFDLVFEPFEQVESYETRQHEGAGLGLSITKELVMLHGGHIDLLSKVGEGTSFRVTIPTTPPDISEADDSDGDDYVSQKVSHATSTTIRHPEIRPKNVKRDEATGGLIHSLNSSMRSIAVVEGEEEDLQCDSVNQEPLRVLVVDDSRVNLKIMANILCKANMEVTTVDSGRLLLQKLVGHHWLDYDVILLDWMMPLMDGITACRLLRKRIACDLLPVMFLTAKTEPADIMKAFGVGATDYATKPFNRYEVVARTESLGRAARRARAHYHDSIPIVSKDSFWKMQPMHPCAVPMFVICFQSWPKTQEGTSSTLDGPHMLHFFRLGAATYESDWKFCEVAEDSVSFFAAQTTAQEATVFLRVIVEGWAESELINSAAVPLIHGKQPRCKPWITVGVDHRIVRTHLFAEQLPMLAAVESCALDAKLLASKGIQHEEILLSESAKAALTI